MLDLFLSKSSLHNPDTIGPWRSKNASNFYTSGSHHLSCITAFTSEKQDAEQHFGQPSSHPIWIITLVSGLCYNSTKLAIHPHPKREREREREITIKQEGWKKGQSREKKRLNWMHGFFHSIITKLIHFSIITKLLQTQSKVQRNGIHHMHLTSC